MYKLRYTIRASGHGSSFVKAEPETFKMTLGAAIEEVDRWRGIACTIGGDAIIVREDGEIIQVGMDKSICEEYIRHERYGR